MMSTYKKTSIAVAALFVFALIGGFWFFNQQQLSKARPDAGLGAISPAQKPKATTKAKANKSLALSKQVQEKIADKNASQSPFRFDAEYIFNALSLVRIDREGNLVLDGQTLDLLEAAVSKLTSDLSDDELSELQELIALGLPGEAGQEAAKIFSDYYHYRGAERELLDASPSSDIDGITSNFEQLVALRQAHLGYDVAEKLYGEEQRASMFMIRAMSIQEDPKLSDDEKEQQQFELAQELEAHLDSSQEPVEAETAQWLLRFKNFDQQRQYILDAGLSKAEQEKQIDDLLEQHFAPNEIEKARTYQLP